MALPAFTLGDARRRVEYHLRDRDTGSESFSLFEKNAAIETHVRLLAPQLLLGDQWSTSLVTLVAGTATYTLPTATSQQYDRLKMLRLQSNGQEVPIVSLQVFESYRAGDTSAQRGTPQCAMVIEGASTVPTLRFWPVPDVSDTCDGFFALWPAALAHNDASAIPFDEAAFEALALSVALELYGKMPEAERGKRGLGPETTTAWPTLIAIGVKASRLRRRRQQGGQVTLRRRGW